MKKYRIRLLAGVGLTMLLMTGCGGTASYTEEQTGQMAEYMAMKLLAYDKGYEEKLVYSEPEKTEEPDAAEVPVIAEQQTEEKTGQNQEKIKVEDSASPPAVTYHSFSETLGISGLEMTYKNYTVCQSYPKDGVSSYFVVEAGLGHKLVVVNFSVKNTKKQKMHVDTMGVKTAYALTVGESSVKPSMTLLTNDLQYLDMELEAGKSQDAVLVFEVSSKEKLNDMELTATCDEKTTSQNLK